MTSMIFEAVGYVLDRLARGTARARSRYQDRLYRRTLKSVGSGVRFNGTSTMTGRASIEVGDNVHIGDNAFIRGEGGLVIGDNTHISRNLVLYTFSHEYEGEALPYDESRRPRPVVIGRNVWIGMNVVVLPGARIGDGAIIGAGAVVHGEVPELAIVGAAGGAVVGRRDEHRYRALEAARRYGGVSGRPIDGP